VPCYSEFYPRQHSTPEPSIDWPLHGPVQAAAPQQDVTPLHRSLRDLATFQRDEHAKCYRSGQLVLLAGDCPVTGYRSSLNQDKARGFSRWFWFGSCVGREGDGLPALYLGCLWRGTVGFLTAGKPSPSLPTHFNFRQLTAGRAVGGHLGNSRTEQAVTL
jgi:hypothetical protein